MPHYMYVSLQDDDKIRVFTMDAATGQLTPKGEVPVSGGPSPLTMSPDRKVLYVGHRNVPGISSFRIDPDTGGLTQSGTVAPEAPPTFLSTDRKGRFLLSAYYQGARAAVHPLGADGAVGGPPIEWLETATGAHAMQTDPSNTFAFVPHIAGNGPNAIFQFRFDENTGHLTPNSPFKVEPAEHLGPRHFCFHPTQNILYFSNEQGCSVTGYRLDHVCGNAVGFSNDHHPASRVRRKEHLLPDSNHALGAILVRAEPRPQQHRELRRRRLLRAVDGHRARGDRSGPQRLQPRP